MLNNNSMGYSHFQVFNQNPNNQFTFAFPNPQQAMASMQAVQAVPNLALPRMGHFDHRLGFNESYSTQQVIQPTFINPLHHVSFQSHPVVPFSVSNQTHIGYQFPLTAMDVNSSSAMGRMSQLSAQQPLNLQQQQLSMGCNAIFPSINFDQNMNSSLLFKNVSPQPQLFSFLPPNQNLQTNFPSHIEAKQLQQDNSYAPFAFDLTPENEKQQNLIGENKLPELKISMKRESEASNHALQTGPRPTQITCQSLSTQHLFDEPQAKQLNSDQFQVVCKEENEHSLHYSKCRKQHTNSKKLKNESAYKQFHMVAEQMIVTRKKVSPSGKSVDPVQVPSFNSSAHSLKKYRKTRSHQSDSSSSSKTCGEEEAQQITQFNTLEKLNQGYLITKNLDQLQEQSKRKKQSNSSQKTEYNTESMGPIKQSEEQQKRELLESLDPLQFRVLRDAVSVNRQNINRNLIKQFKSFVETQVSYTLGYEQEDASKYHFKTCRLSKVIRTDNPTPKQKLFFSKKFKKFIASKHHSNADIKQIIENKIYGYLFREFLVLSAPQWIETHMQGQRQTDYDTILQFYLLCLEKNPFLLFLNDTSLNRKNTSYFNTKENQQISANQPTSSTQPIQEISLKQLETTTADNLMVREVEKGNTNQIDSTDSKYHTGYQDQRVVIEE